MNQTKITPLAQKRLLPIPYLTALAHFAIEFSFNALPILYPLLIVSMGLSYQQVGAIALVVTLGATITQPVFGYLSDRLGRRAFMVFSVAWVGILLGLTGFIQSYWLVLLVVGLGALGSAAFHPAGIAVATGSDPEHRGAAASIFSVSGSLGTIFSPLLFGLGIARFGARMSIILIPITLLVTIFLYSQYRSIDEANRSTPAATKPVETQSDNNKSLWLLVLVIIIVAARSWVHGSIITYLPEWLLNSGLTTEITGIYISILMVMIGLGSLVGGILSDRLGRAPVAAVSFLFIGPAFWLFLNQADVFQPILIGLVGFALGISFPITIVMAQEAWPQGAGLASALVMGIGWLPYGIGSWTIGRIADLTTLTNALNTLIYIPLISLVATAIIGLPAIRLESRQKLK